MLGSTECPACELGIVKRQLRIAVETRDETLDLLASSADTLESQAERLDNTSMILIDGGASRNGIAIHNLINTAAVLKMRASIMRKAVERTRGDEAGN